MKFNIFRNPFIYKYVQGWQDGYNTGYEAAKQQYSYQQDIQWNTKTPRQQLDDLYAYLEEDIEVDDFLDYHGPDTLREP